MMLFIMRGQVDGVVVQVGKWFVPLRVGTFSRLLTPISRLLRGLFPPFQVPSTLEIIPLSVLRSHIGSLREVGSSKKHTTEH